MNKTEVVCTAVSNVKTSGGGFSQYYSRPSFQDASVSAYFVAAAKAGQSPVSGYSTGGRGYPDVSLAGYHYKTLIAGNLYGLSGTSASAPTFAGFVSNVNAARLAIGKGSLGWLNPTLYANYTLFANDVTSGNNRCVGSNLCCSQGYYAAPGWDPATGLGSINYGKFQHFLLSLGTLSGNSLTDPPTQSPTFRPSPAPTSSPTTRTPTLAPTTRSPTTKTPTQSPTTRTPTTQSPTRTPTTQSPTTQSPSTLTPTRTPTTQTPSTQSPSTQMPSTRTPSSQSPSQAPPTHAPSTHTPTVAIMTMFRATHVSITCK